MRRTRRLLLAIQALFSLAACADGEADLGEAGPVAVVVAPPSARVEQLASMPFTAAVSGAADTSVVWSIRESGTSGQVTPGGLYTAPATGGTFHVVATAVADPSVSGSATVTVTVPDLPPTIDRFGVKMIYPTVSGGREWFLPDTAQVPDSEWVPEADGIQRLGPGVFAWDGEAGTDSQIRMNVHSPSGKAWWRNVEMTIYSRSRGKVMGGTCTQHWELEARGDQHTDASTVPWSSINDGVPAPAGTSTWPWYGAFSGSQRINAHCVGTAYHGNLYVTGNTNGQMVLEKELSHTAGYADDWKGVARPGAYAPGAWIGYKLVVRNFAGDTAVHLELWEDRLADGAWSKVSSYDDTGSGAGSWGASTDLDGCSAAPYGYATDQVMTWAGPWLGFRSDCQGIDFKWLSAREVEPLE